MDNEKLVQENKKLHDELIKLRWENQALNGALNHASLMATQKENLVREAEVKAEYYRKFAWFIAGWAAVIVGTAACVATAIYMTF